MEMVPFEKLPGLINTEDKVEQYEAKASYTKFLASMVLIMFGMFLFVVLSAIAYLCMDFRKRRRNNNKRKEIVENALVYRFGNPEDDRESFSQLQQKKIESIDLKMIYEAIYQVTAVNTLKQEVIGDKVYFAVTILSMIIMGTVTIIVVSTTFVLLGSMSVPVVDAKCWNGEGLTLCSLPLQFEGYAQYDNNTRVLEWDNPIKSICEKAKILKFTKIVYGSKGSCGDRETLDEFWNAINQPKHRSNPISSYSAPGDQSWCKDAFSSYHYFSYVYAEMDYIESQWCVDTVDVMWKIRGAGGDFRLGRLDFTTNRLALTDGYVPMTPEYIFPLQNDRQFAGNQFYMVTESESHFDKVHLSDGVLVLQEPLRQAILDKINQPLCCEGEENTVNERTIERLDPVFSPIIDNLILVSDSRIEIIVDNCTELIVNFYQPELEFNNISQQVQNYTRVLLLRSLNPCYMNELLVPQHFITVSYDPNINFTQMNGCNVKITPGTNNTFEYREGCQASHFPEISGKYATNTSINTDSADFFERVKDAFSVGTDIEVMLTVVTISSISCICLIFTACCWSNIKVCIIKMRECYKTKVREDSIAVDMLTREVLQEIKDKKEYEQHSERIRKEMKNNLRQIQRDLKKKSTKKFVDFEQERVSLNEDMLNHENEDSDHYDAEGDIMKKMNVNNRMQKIEEENRIYKKQLMEAMKNKEQVK